MTYFWTPRVYAADVSCLEDAALFDRFYAGLPSDRQEKITKYRFDRDKRLSLGAGILLKKALSDAGCKKVPELSYQKDGKPFFAALPDFHFNLSHSGRWVLCAVFSQEIGCDVEKLGSCDPALAKRFFHPQEYEAILACPTQAEKDDLFFRLWTLKESYIKAVGRGLSMGLDSFCISISEDELSLQAQSSKPYTLFSLSVASDYRAACCVQGNSKQPELCLIDFTAL